MSAAKCPKCKETIKSLDYVEKQIQIGSFTLDGGHEEEVFEADSESIEYSCPECNKTLCTDEDEAGRILKGTTQKKRSPASR